MHEGRLYKIISSIDYLMFRGGSGGEFLTSSIYKYSNRYKNNITSLYQDNTNKTVINYLRLFSEISNLPQQNISLTDLSTRISEQDITDAEVFLEAHKNLLVRLHYTNYEPILNQSYFLLLDNEKWFDYAGLLVSFKNIYSKNEILEYFVLQDRKFGRKLQEKELLVEKVLNFMSDNNIDKISTIKLHLIHMLSSDVDKILESSISELYSKYRYFIHGDFEEYSKAMKQKPFKKIINYSEIFKKGYLEEIFDINSPLFHEELMQWHENNLKLLAHNGVDIELFRI